MNDEMPPANPLRTLLAEMRESLDGMIGDEISQLLGYANERHVPAISATSRHEPRPREKWPLLDRSEPMTANKSNVQPLPLTNPTPASDHGEGMERADDAGLRLDALARRLEGRLKRPRGRSAEPKSRAQRGDSGVESSVEVDYPQSGGGR